MRQNSDKLGLITVGGRDPRVTLIGYYLRKYKIDELPQLINVLIGDMSLVGPRPEVPEYVQLYNEKQQEILKVKPGITDYASIAYFNENELLAKSENPEKTYIEEVMPAKIRLNEKYLENPVLSEDLKIIFLTFLKILRIKYQLFLHLRIFILNLKLDYLNQPIFPLAEEQTKENQYWFIS